MRLPTTSEPTAPQMRLTRMMASRARRLKGLSRTVPEKAVWPTVKINSSSQAVMVRLVLGGRGGLVAGAGAYFHHRATGPRGLDRRGRRGTLALPTPARQECLAH